MIFLNIEGPGALVWSYRLDEKKWSYRIVRHCHTRPGSIITLSFKFKVKPHDKFFGFCVVDNFGSFQNAPLGNIRC
ncbi:hypothetical protein SDC9_124070 [bioreactor metagenome]|uniref:Uncharacterized protein n=1 Tax=bioreactor metagenome TaxID=1076179 RepID=A0A645CJD9_9ZZZZ